MRPRGGTTSAVAGGHDVTIIDRTPDKVQALADTVNADASGAGSAAAGSLEADDGDVVVLATF
jgi:shikimate 5-dehydrogenase